MEDPTTTGSSSSSSSSNVNPYPNQNSNAIINDGNTRDVDDAIDFNNNNNNNTTTTQQQTPPQPASQQLQGVLAIGNNNSSSTTTDNDDDDAPGFDDYIEITTETGYLPLLVVSLFGMFSQFLLLPILIVSCRRRRRSNNNNNRHNKTLRPEEQHVAAATPRAVVHDHNTDAAGRTTSNNLEGREMTSFDETWPFDFFILDAALRHPHRPHHRHTPTTIKSRIAEEARLSTLRRAKEEGEENKEDRQFDSDNNLPPSTPSPPPQNCDNDNFFDVRPVLILPNDDEKRKRTRCRHRFVRFFVLDPWHNFISVVRYDNETKRILRLAIPFTISEVIQAISEVILLGLVSYQLGTGALSAFAVVETLIEITTEFAMGVVDAQTSLTGHAYGAKNNVLAGQYAQLCPMVYVLFQVPFIVVWSFATYDIMLWMDFPPTVAIMAQDYGRLVVWRNVVSGLSYSLYAMFEVADKELAIALIRNIEAVVGLAVITIALLLFDGNLVTVGTIAIVNALLFYVFTIIFTYWKGWMKPFAKGMFGSLAWKVRLRLRLRLRLIVRLQLIVRLILIEMFLNLNFFFAISTTPDIC